MGLGMIWTRRGGRLTWAGILLGVCASSVSTVAHAQFFNLPSFRSQGEVRPQGEMRPPADIPAEQSLVPPGESATPAQPQPRGPTLQALPPPSNPTLAPPQAQRPSAPQQAQLALAARYGSNLPQITGGLHWRIYPAKPDQ